MAQACGILKICGDGGTGSELKEFRRRRREEENEEEEEGGGGGGVEETIKNEEVGEEQKCGDGLIIEV